MAIYHLSAGIVSRSKGMSAIAKSSYNSCDKIKNEYDGTIHNYSNKPYHTYHEILLPKNAPLEYRDKAKLWNAVELSEKSKNAQLCRSFDVALPKELSQEEQEKLIRDFCKENFMDRGMCVQIDIHSNPENPHAHVMTTLREIDENGNWKAKRKDVYKLDENGERIPIIDKKTGLQKTDNRNRKQWERETIKTNDWDSKEFLLEVRKNWSDKCNEKLREKGAKEITHKSHKDMEFYKQPQIHLGSYNHKLMKEGKTNDRIEQYKNIIEQNRQIREIRQAFNRFFEKLKKESRPTNSRIDLLLMAKQNEERAKLSVEELKFKIENNLLTIDRKKEELKELEGKWFKGKEKAELQERIDELKAENHRLSETLKAKKNSLAIEQQNRERKEKAPERVVDPSRMEKFNRPYERKEPDMQAPERQEQIKKMQEFDKQFNSLGIKARPKENNDMLKARDKAKPIVKEFSGNKQHDMGNPLEKSNKAKAKDEHIKRR